MNDDTYNKLKKEATRFVAHERVGYVMYKDQVDTLLIRAFMAGAEMLRLEAKRIADRPEFHPAGQEIAALIKGVWNG